MHLKCRAVYLNNSPFGSRNIADPRLAQSRAIDIKKLEDFPEPGGPKIAIWQRTCLKGSAKSYLRVSRPIRNAPGGKACRLSKASPDSLSVPTSAQRAEPCVTRCVMR